MIPRTRILPIAVSIGILCLACSCSLQSGKGSGPADEAERAFCAWQAAKPELNIPYSVTVFSDYECPACHRAGRVLRDAKKNYPQQFVLTIRHYPLDVNCNRAIARPLHMHACRAAEYVLCAGAQSLDASWKLHDELLSLHDFSITSLRNAVGDSGLDEPRITECVRSGQARARLSADIEEGIALGLDGTPRIFINGKRVPQLRSVMLERFIDILAEGKLVDCRLPVGGQG